MPRERGSDASAGRARFWRHLIGFPLVFNMVELAKSTLAVNNSLHKASLSLQYIRGIPRQSTQASPSLFGPTTLLSVKVGAVPGLSVAWAARDTSGPCALCFSFRLSRLLRSISSSSTHRHPSTSLLHLGRSSRSRVLPSTIIHLHHFKASFAPLLGTTRHSGLRTRRKFLHSHGPRLTLTPTSPQWPTKQLSQLQ